MTKKRRRTKKKENTKKTQQQRWIAIAVVVIAIVAVFIAANSGSAPATVNSLPAEINTEMGYQMFQDGAFLLDVRTQHEWEEYHVDGAARVVLDELESRVSEVPFDQEVIIICNSGNRSQVARDILLQAGHTSVTSIAGGIQGWMSAGHAVVSGP